MTFFHFIMSLALVLVLVRDSCSIDAYKRQTKTYGVGCDDWGSLGTPAGSKTTDNIVQVEIPNPVTFGYVQVDAGDHYSLFLTHEGEVYGVGNQDYGELSIGNYNQQHYPQLATMPRPIQKIAAGRYHSLFLTVDGEVYCSGQSDRNQCGDGDTSSRNTAQPVSTANALNGVIVEQIAAGRKHSLFLANGVAYSVGANDDGQLGDNSYDDRSVPVEVYTDNLLNGVEIEHIAAGGHHSLFLADGLVYATGLNDEDQLGIYSAVNSVKEVEMVHMAGALNGTTIQAVSGGFYHTLFLDTSGIVYSVGKNDDGQLGVTGGSRDQPVEVYTGGYLNGKIIKAISAGALHSIVLSTDGEVFSFGWGYWGQLGRGSTSSSDEAVRTSHNSIMDGLDIVQMSGGYDHSIFQEGSHCINGAKRTEINQCVLCANGEWSEGNLNTTCYPCPESEKCSNGVKSSCLNPPNYPYPGEGQSECRVCPEKNYVDSSGRACLNCTIGYSCPGDGQRHTCDSPYFSYASQASCTECKPGHYLTYYTDSETFIDMPSCQPCDIGYACPDGSSRVRCDGISQYSDTVEASLCKVCPTGNYVNADHTLCLACTGVESCPNGADHFYCENGQFVQSGTVCTECPIGHVCDGVEKYDCDTGYYSPDTDRSMCLECPVGHACGIDGQKELCSGREYSIAIGNDACADCAVNRFTLNTSRFCFPCMFGFKCQDGENLHPSPLGTFCSPGYHYDDTSPTLCSECPLGSTTDGFGATSVEECIKCPPGEYQSHPTEECIPCPSNTFSNYSGAFSVNGTVCQDCPLGTVSEPGSTLAECIPCDVGQFRNGSMNACMDCPLGTFTGSVGSIECEPCQPGSFNDEFGMASCQNCTEGTYGPYSGQPSNSSCLSCPGTTISPVGSQSIEDCMQCAIEKVYDPETGSCEYCPVGMEPIDHACVLCPAGQFRNESTTNCLDCPPGTFSDSDGMSECLPCPSSTYSNHTGASSVSQCTPCQMGSFAPEEGSVACSPCPSGYYGVPCNGDELESCCLKCKKGTFLSMEGAANASLCAPCPSGYTSTPGSDQCYACPAGTYQTDCDSLPDSDDCCAYCRRGTYSGHDGSTECILCPAGTYSNMTGADNLSDCIPCPIGTVSTSAGAFTIGQCQECPRGAFCPQEGMGSPYNCRRGTYSSKLGATSSSTCESCRSGTYSSVPGAPSADSCQPCPQGSFSSIEGAVSELQCIFCDKGRASDALSATSNSTCKICQTGSYAGRGSSSCKLCPYHTYNNQTGSSTIDDCLRCPEGTVTNTIGASNIDACFRCDNGYYYSPTTRKCTPCAAGMYYDTRKEYHTTDASACHACKPGTFQPLEGMVGSDSCIQCELGTYSEHEASPQCTPCGKGYHSDILGSNSHTNCVACDPGTYSAAEIADTPLTCAFCPPGTFNNQSASPSVSYCKLCSSGFMSPFEGGTYCKACSSTEACPLAGSSFEISPSLVEKSIIDPKKAAISGRTLSQSIQYAIAGGFLFMMVVLVVMLLCVCCICCRMRTGQHMSKMDSFFSMSHDTPEGSANIRQPTGIGGVLSLIVLAMTLSMILYISLEFLTNNSLISERYIVKVPDRRRGYFEFMILALGNHSQCTGSIQEMTGIIHDGYSAEWRQGAFEYINGEVTACGCTISCPNCVPRGTTLRIALKFDGLMMSNTLLFSVKVPHFVEGEAYSAHENLSSDTHVYTGDASPHTLQFFLSDFEHLSVSWTNIFTSIVGYEEQHKSTGYSTYLLNKSPGSMQLASNFHMQNGLRMELEFESSIGVTQLEERQKQTFVTFLSQLSSISGIVVTVGLVMFRIWMYSSNITQRVSRHLKGNVVAPEKLIDEYPFDTAMDPSIADSL